MAGEGSSQGDKYGLFSWGQMPGNSAGAAVLDRFELLHRRARVALQLGIPTHCLGGYLHQSFQYRANQLVQRGYRARWYQRQPNSQHPTSRSIASKPYTKITLLRPLATEPGDNTSQARSRSPSPERGTSSRLLAAQRPASSPFIDSDNDAGVNGATTPPLLPGRERAPHQPSRGPCAADAAEAAPASGRGSSQADPEGGEPGLAGYLSLDPGYKRPSPWRDFPWNIGPDFDSLDEDDLYLMNLKLAACQFAKLEEAADKAVDSPVLSEELLGELAAAFGCLVSLIGDQPADEVASALLELPPDAPERTRVAAERKALALGAVCHSLAASRFGGVRGGSPMALRRNAMILGDALLAHLGLPPLDAWELRVWSCALSQVAEARLGRLQGTEAPRAGALTDGSAAALSSVSSSSPSGFPPSSSSPPPDPAASVTPEERRLVAAFSDATALYDIVQHIAALPEVRHASEALPYVMARLLQQHGAASSIAVAATEMHGRFTAKSGGARRRRQQQQALPEQPSLDPTYLLSKYSGQLTGFGMRSFERLATLRNDMGRIKQHACVLQKQDRLLQLMHLRQMKVLLLLSDQQQLRRRLGAAAGLGAEAGAEALAAAVAEAEAAKAEADAVEMRCGRLMAQLGLLGEVCREIEAVQAALLELERVVLPALLRRAMATGGAAAAAGGGASSSSLPPPPAPPSLPPVDLGPGGGPGSGLDLGGRCALARALLGMELSEGRAPLISCTGGGPGLQTTLGSFALLNHLRQHVVMPQPFPHTSTTTVTASSTAAAPAAGCSHAASAVVAEGPRGLIALRIMQLQQPPSQQPSQEQERKQPKRKQGQQQGQPRGPHGPRDSVGSAGGPTPGPCNAAEAPAFRLRLAPVVGGKALSRVVRDVTAAAAAAAAGEDGAPLRLGSGAGPSEVSAWRGELLRRLEGRRCAVVECGGWREVELATQLLAEARSTLARSRRDVVVVPLPLLPPRHGPNHATNVGTAAPSAAANGIGGAPPPPPPPPSSRAAAWARREVELRDLGLDPEYERHLKEQMGIEEEGLLLGSAGRGEEEQRAQARPGQALGAGPGQQPSGEQGDEQEDERAGELRLYCAVVEHYVWQGDEERAPWELPRGRPSICSQSAPGPGGGGGRAPPLPGWRARARCALRSIVGDMLRLVPDGRGDGNDDEGEEEAGVKGRQEEKATGSGSGVHLTRLLTAPLLLVAVECERGGPDSAEPVEGLRG